jgi:hypothetical protein
MKVKRANRLMSIIDEIWVIHLQKVDTLLMIGKIKDLYSRKDRNLARFNIDCM